jgi:hypothetical protein
MVSPKSILQITFAVEVRVERTQDAVVVRFDGTARVRYEGGKRGASCWFLTSSSPASSSLARSFSTHTSWLRCTSYRR